MLEVIFSTVRDVYYELNIAKYSRDWNSVE